MVKCVYQMQMEEMGLDYEAMFEMIFCELDYLTIELSKEHISEDSFDINSFLLKRVQKLLEVLQSLHLIYNAHSDVSSLSALARIVSEYYATLHLVFVHTVSPEEQVLRFLLYLKDGAMERKKNLETRSKTFDPKYITKKEFDQIEQQCNEAVENDKSAIAHIDKLLSDAKYSAINREIIEHSNWRYKSPHQGKKNNTYSWHNLCALYDEENALTISGYLSQFVHGLGISYMQHTNDITSKYSIAASITIMDRAKKLLHQRFATSIKTYNIDFRKTDMAKCFLLGVPQAYLDRITKKIQSKIL